MLGEKIYFLVSILTFKKTALLCIGSNKGREQIGQYRNGERAAFTKSLTRNGVTEIVLDGHD